MPKDKDDDDPCQQFRKKKDPGKDEPADPCEESSCSKKSPCEQEKDVSEKPSKSSPCEKKVEDVSGKSGEKKGPAQSPKRMASNLINSFRDKAKKMIPDMSNMNYKQAIASALSTMKDWIKENCDPRKMADKSGPPSRPMKFPYTFTAKFAQFPLQHYIKNQWIWRYYFIALGCCIPVFYSINKLANSPGNVAKWAEIRRKEAAEHHN